MEKLFDNPKVPNQANQIQTPVVCRDTSHAQGASRSQEIETRSFHEEAVKHDSTGDLLFAVTQVTRKVPPKHVPLMTARTSTLKMKQIMIERETRRLQ